MIFGVQFQAQAAEIDHANEYRSCIKEALRDPNKAYVGAVRWKDLGGGNGAEHCATMALIGMAFYKDAAARLEVLAQSSKRKPALKAQLLGQAAQAWLLDGNPSRAEATASAALALDPNNSNLLIDRAQAKAARKDYVGGLNDLDKALSMDSSQIDAFVFRATAKRYLDDLAGAMDDLNAALSLNNSHTDALLERGILYRLQNNNDAARQDWLMVLSIAPQSNAAPIAQKNLERMDVKTQ